jgi:PAS domain S-box-containing protein
VNQPWLDFTGRALGDELGDRWLATVDPDDQRRVWDAVSAALSKRQPFTIEYRLQRRDGEARWLLDHGVPLIENGEELRGYIGSAIDVTDLRRAQEALLEANALRGVIFGSLQGRVAAVDRHGVVIAANESWDHAAQRAEAAGGVSVRADYLDACRGPGPMEESDASRAREAVTAVLDGLTWRAQLEYVSRTPSGDRWFELTVEALRRPEGGAVISHVDVTRRHEAEEEIRRQRDELAHALRVTALGELAGSIAHEINQPLATIVTEARTAQRELAASSPSVHEALGDIVAEAMRAADIIQRLRSLFRKERQRRVAVDVNGLVGDAMTLLRGDLRRRDIRVNLVLRPDLRPVGGDPVQLQQVLLNVLMNACDAIDGGVVGPREIAIRTAAPNEQLVEVSIEDTGPGLKETELARIFEHFVTTKPDGLGMGLAISRSIIEVHDGRIWASPNHPRGLTIHIELPVDPRSEPT